MVVAADTAALKESALCQQTWADLTCISTAGAFVTLAYGTLVDPFEQSMTDAPLTQQPLCACLLCLPAVSDMSCPSSAFEMEQINIK